MKKKFFPIFFHFFSIFFPLNFVFVVINIFGFHDQNKVMSRPTDNNLNYT